MAAQDAMERAGINADLLPEFGVREVFLETDAIHLVDKLCIHIACDVNNVPVRARQAISTHVTLAARATHVVKCLPVSEFRDLLEAAAKAYPTKREFARAIGITPGRLSRVLGGEHSLDVGNCLTLATLTGESPSRVLRAAGKGDIADAIEALYGPSAPSVSPKEREILDAWNALTPGARDALRLTMTQLPRIPAKAEQAISRRRRSGAG